MDPSWLLKRPKNRFLCGTSYPNAFQVSLAEGPADPLPVPLWDGSLHALPQLGVFQQGHTSQLLEPLATIQYPRAVLSASARRSGLLAALPAALVAEVPDRDCLDCFTVVHAAPPEDLLVKLQVQLLHHPWVFPGALVLREETACHRLYMGCFAPGAGVSTSPHATTLPIGRVQAREVRLMHGRMTPDKTAVAAAPGAQVMSFFSLAGTGREWVAIHHVVPLTAAVDAHVVAGLSCSHTLAELLAFWSDDMGMHVAGGATDATGAETAKFLSEPVAVVRALVAGTAADMTGSHATFKPFVPTHPRIPSSHSSHASRMHVSASTARAAWSASSSARGMGTVPGAGGSPALGVMRAGPGAGAGPPHSGAASSGFMVGSRGSGSTPYVSSGRYGASGRSLSNPSFSATTAPAAVPPSFRVGSAIPSWDAPGATPAAGVRGSGHHAARAAGVRFDHVEHDTHHRHGGQLSTPSVAPAGRKGLRTPHKLSTPVARSASRSPVPAMANIVDPGAGRAGGSPPPAPAVERLWMDTQAAQTQLNADRATLDGRAAALSALEDDLRKKSAALDDLRDQVTALQSKAAQELQEAAAAKAMAMEAAKDSHKVQKEEHDALANARTTAAVILRNANDEATRVEQAAKSAASKRIAAAKAREASARSEAQEMLERAASKAATTVSDAEEKAAAVVAAAEKSAASTAKRARDEAAAVMKRAQAAAREVRAGTSEDMQAEIDRLTAAAREEGATEAEEAASKRIAQMEANVAAREELVRKSIKDLEAKHARLVTARHAGKREAVTLLQQLEAKLRAVEAREAALEERQLAAATWLSPDKPRGRRLATSTSTSTSTSRHRRPAQRPHFHAPTASSVRKIASPEAAAAAGASAAAVTATSLRTQRGGWRMSHVHAQRQPSSTSTGGSPGTARPRRRSSSASQPRRRRSSPSRLVPGLGLHTSATTASPPRPSRAGGVTAPGAVLPLPFCAYCGSLSHVAMTEDPDAPNQREPACPCASADAAAAGGELPTDLVDDAGGPLPEEWQAWCEVNASSGVHTALMLAILSENGLRPRTAVNLYGTQQDMQERALLAAQAQALTRGFDVGVVGAVNGTSAVAHHDGGGGGGDGGGGGGGDGGGDGGDGDASDDEEEEDDVPFGAPPVTAPTP